MTLGMASWNDEGLCRHTLTSLDLNHPRRFFYVCAFHVLIVFLYFMFSIDLGG